MFKLQPGQIEAWVARNFAYKRRKNGREILICNPDSSDTKYHLSISTEYKSLKNRNDRNGNPVYGYWVNDFRPNHQQFNGSLVNFIRKYKKISYVAALSELSGSSVQLVRDQLRRHGREIQEQVTEPSPPASQVELPSYSVPFSDDGDSRIRQVAVNYLRNRSISEEVAIQHKLCYTPTGLVFPYMEYDEVVYWQSRELLDKMFMFPDLETTGLAKTDYLYNFDEVLQPCECLVVVESIFNCLSIGEDCVATGGAKIPDRAKQIIKLKLLDPKVIVLAPDNDEAGLTSLRDNYYILKDHFRLAYCLPPKGLDWNDLDVKNGHGTARRYIEGYTKQLDLFALCDRLEVV